MKKRCHYCSRWLHPGEVLPMGTGGAVMCLRCRVDHARQMHLFSKGLAPTGCPGWCKRSFEELLAASADGNVRMCIQFMDGIYVLLCRSCSDQYVKKRVDLFGDTLYGDQKKLKGSK